MHLSDALENPLIRVLNHHGDMLVPPPGYHNILKRMKSHNSLTVVHNAEDDDANENDGYNQQSVRYTLYSALFAQRAAFNHVFFSAHLPVSSTTQVSFYDEVIQGETLMTEVIHIGKYRMLTQLLVEYF